MTEKLLLRPEEAFAAIQVKRAKGYQMLADGEILSIKVGRLRRVPVDALHKWLEGKIRKTESICIDG